MNCIPLLLPCDFDPHGISEKARLLHRPDHQKCDHRHEKFLPVCGNEGVFSTYNVIVLLFVNQEFKHDLYTKL